MLGKSYQLSLAEGALYQRTDYRFDPRELSEEGRLFVEKVITNFQKALLEMLPEQTVKQIALIDSVAYESLYWELDKLQKLKSPYGAVYLDQEIPAKLQSDASRLNAHYAIVLDSVIMEESEKTKVGLLKDGWTFGFLI